MLRPLARALAALVLPVALVAQPGVYTFTGTASGAYGGVAFLDQPFTATLTAASFTAAPGAAAGVAALTVATGTFDVAHVVSGGTIGVPLIVYDNRIAQGLGFGLGVAAPDVLDLFAPGMGLDTYNLLAAFGPIPAASIVNQVTGLDVAGQPLTFTQVRDLSFTAVLIPSTTTPEPASLALLGTGLAGLGLTARRRRRA